MRFGPLAVLAAAIACGPAPDAVRDTAQPRGASEPRARLLDRHGQHDARVRQRIRIVPHHVEDAEPGRRAAGSVSVDAAQRHQRAALKVIADQQGAGGGSAEFGDDPRLYEFLVESSRLDWSISVQETFAPRQ